MIIKFKILIMLLMNNILIMK